MTNTMRPEPQTEGEIFQQLSQNASNIVRLSDAIRSIQSRCALLGLYDHADEVNKACGPIPNSPSPRPDIQETLVHHNNRISNIANDAENLLSYLNRMLA